MKFLVFGAGGTGGPLAFFLCRAGKDVTVIARNAQLDAIRKNGLTLDRVYDGTRETVFPKACTAEEYADSPDVILVCVKGYSLDSVVPFLKRTARPDTVIIPILNIYGTGERLQAMLPDCFVTDGCIYVSAMIGEPGVIRQTGKILRVVFGVREKESYRPVLETIRDELSESGIEPLLSDNIRRDALEKFSYVSPIGAAGIYLNATAGDFQKEGEARDLFVEMIREIMALAEKMGCPFEKDYVPVNLKILSGLGPESTTSMQRDVMEGRPSELDGLVREPIRLGEKYGLPMKAYRRVEEGLRAKGL